ncbi:MAG TPA: histidine kinase [Chitinophagaceae bacterium]|nr:histidine kinase [Chitinophagaceae bacterium]
MDTNETAIFIAVLITAILIGALLIYFGLMMFRNHRRYFKIMQKNFLEEMEVLERERTRIARDLHDELGPLLAVTRIQIKTVEGITPEDKIHLEKAVHNIDVLTTRFRGIAQNLTPRVLVTKGLKTALSDFLEQYEEVSTIRMQFDYRIQSPLFVNISLQIFRMVQELVHNAVKHSGANELQIQLAERKKKIYLYLIRITENGRIMSQQKTQAGSG